MDCWFISPTSRPRYLFNYDDAYEKFMDLWKRDVGAILIGISNERYSSMYYYVDQDLELQNTTKIDVGNGNKSPNLSDFVVKRGDVNQPSNLSGSIMKRGDINEPSIPNGSMMKGKDEKDDEELVDTVCNSISLDKLS